MMNTTVFKKIRNAKTAVRTWIERAAFYPAICRASGPMRKQGFFATDCQSLGLTQVPELFAFLDKIVAEREAKLPRQEGYPFRKTCLNNADLFAQDALLLRFSLQERLLAEARNYLPFRPYLRCIELWIDEAEPAAGQRSTQFFHVDADDAYNFKVFIYLSDVSMKNGPFTFMSVSYVNALSRRKPRPLAGSATRIADSEIMRFGKPQSLPGKRGSVIFADTCFGYHKGLLPEQGKRVMLAIQFTSKRAWYPPVIGLPKTIPLDSHLRENILSE